MPSKSGANYTIELIDTGVNGYNAAQARLRIVDQGSRIMRISVRRIVGAADVQLHVGAQGNAIRVRQGNRIRGPIETGLYLTQAINVQTELAINMADSDDEAAASFEVFES